MIKAANVFLSFDYEVIKNLFLNPQTPISILDLQTQAEKDEESIFFTTTKSTGLLSFTHEFTANVFAITLEVLDPEKKLLAKLMSPGMPLPDPENRVRLKNNFVDPRLQDIEESLKLLEKEQSNIQKNRLDKIELENTTKKYNLMPGSLRANKKKDLFDSLIKDKTKLKEEGLNGLSIAEAALGKQIPLQSPVVYFAYGIGDNIRDWAGPIKATLKTAQAQITGDGLRKYTFTFAPQFSPYLLGPTNQVNLSLHGFGVYCEGKEEIDLLETGLDVLLTNFLRESNLFEWENKKDVINFNTELGVKFLFQLTQKIDFHRLVSLAVARYLAAICNVHPNHVIVVLPNLNIVCYNLFKQIVLTHFKNRASNAHFRISFYNAWDSFDVIFAVLEDCIRGCLNEFGMELVRDNLNAYPFYGSFPFLVEKRKVAQYKYKAIISNKLKTTKVDDLEIANEYYSFVQPLENLKNGINRNSLLHHNWELTTLVETDLNVLKTLWQFPQFKGTQMPESLIIFGDESLIRMSIYGDYDTRSRKEEPADTKIRQILFSLDKRALERKTLGIDSIDVSALETSSLRGGDIGKQKTIEENLVKTKRLENQLQKYLGDIANVVKNYIGTGDALYFSNDELEKIYSTIAVFNDSSLTFGDFESAPDELALFDLFAINPNLLSQEEYQKFIGELQTLVSLTKKRSIPIFRSNIRNSNILSLTINNDNTLYAGLQSVYVRQLAFKAAQSIRDSVAEYVLSDPKKLADLVDLFKRYKKRTNSITEFSLQQNLTTLVKEPLASLEDLVLASLITYDNLITKPLRPVRYYNEKTGFNPIVLTNQLSTKLMEMARIVTIKTLPYFTLCRNSDKGRSCLLLAKDLTVAGANIQADLIDTFYTGSYSLMGFKHIISAKEVASEFNLVKLAVGQTDKKSILPAEDKTELLKGDLESIDFT